MWKCLCGTENDNHVMNCVTDHYNRDYVVRKRVEEERRRSTKLASGINEQNHPTTHTVGHGQPAAQRPHDSAPPHLDPGYAVQGAQATNVTRGTPQGYSSMAILRPISTALKILPFPFVVVGYVAAQVGNSLSLSMFGPWGDSIRPEATSTPWAQWTQARGTTGPSGAESGVGTHRGGGYRDPCQAPAVSPLSVPPAGRGPPAVPPSGDRGAP
jgi:hypothetical protein